MGPEFATVTTAIDNTGHCVCYITGLGKLTVNVFTDLFEKHLNSPAYICTDETRFIVITATCSVLPIMRDHQTILKFLMKMDILHQPDMTQR